MFRFLLVFCSFVLCAWSEAAELKPKPLDRALDKLAGAMLREFPELKKDQRTSLARAALVKEFKRKGAGKISAKVLSSLKRRKVDYKEFKWVSLLERFERAKLTEPKCAFLLKRAKRQRLSVEEHYVIKHLMEQYYSEQVAAREELSKKRLRIVGRAYTEYIRENGGEPQDLEDFVKGDDARFCLNPLTGESQEWLYVGAGPVFISGVYRQRMVAYSPYLVGKSEQQRWVGYKGGKVGVWKNEAMLEKHKKMERNCAQFVIQKEQEKERVAEQAELRKKREIKEAEAAIEAKKLKITIRELW